ncbi:helix-turn-helix domain-containing protein [Leptodesmis sichuanensis]|uniref:helix-turn-helix domain-containing protein n=1 Tax=Leptodesmis sichuanensis TaxID=2906798 RepID=UPI001F32DF47|nr:helix-turn-helix domain-containing protein [Leptodesmis sichuanensis]UIE36980.1 helix-turn-helix domain-containing protein [Leptodesmis sichuanensis A121]
MSARKLSDSEKQTILQLYRETSETSSSLAARYGVSTSTVSRLLKSTLPADEYEALIQQKRAARSADNQSVELPDAALVESVKHQLDLGFVEPEPQPAAEEAAPRRTVAPPVRRSRKRSSVAESATAVAASPAIAPDVDGAEVTPELEPGEVRNPVAAEVLKEILSDEVLDLEEEEEEDLEDDLDEDEDEDEDDLDSRLPDRELFVGSPGGSVQVLPLAEATIPRTCYLVVDRSAELIAPPLKEFGDLGQIPEAEIQEKTLPIFDNHRVAKRYSNPRTQRVIKLPDGKVLQKAIPHLQAKGITRVLIDGRVYSF